MCHPCGELPLRFGPDPLDRLAFKKAQRRACGNCARQSEPCASQQGAHLILVTKTRAVRHQHKYVVETPVACRWIRLGDEKTTASRDSMAAVLQHHACAILIENHKDAFKQVGVATSRHALAEIACFNPTAPI